MNLLNFDWAYNAFVKCISPRISNQNQDDYITYMPIIVVGNCC